MVIVIWFSSFVKDKSSSVNSFHLIVVERVFATHSFYLILFLNSAFRDRRSAILQALSFSSGGVYIALHAQIMKADYKMLRRIRNNIQIFHSILALPPEQ